MPNPEHVSTFTPFRRDLLRTVTTPLFRYETVYDPKHGLFDFEAKLQEKPSHGGLILHRHFADTDPQIVFHSIIFNSSVMMDCQIACIVQRDIIRALPLLLKFADSLGVKLLPIETPKSTQQNQNGRRPMRPREGVVEATQKALEIIKNGGIVILAPEGGKQGRLEDFKVKTVGWFMLGAQKAEVGEFPVLPVHLKLAGTDGNYKREMGFKAFRKYTVTAGRMLTSGQILDMAGGRLSRVDNVILHQMQQTAALARR